MGEIPIVLRSQPHSPQYYYPIPYLPRSSFFSSIPKPILKPNTLKLKSFSISCSYSHDNVGIREAPLLSEESGTSRGVNCNNPRKKRVFFLDVNPLCYKGCTPSLQAFAHWVSLFFSQVSHSDPVIAVIDGERANEYRRKLLPTYKAHRKKLLGSTSKRFTAVERSHKLILDVLKKCNVPVVKLESHEADDVVATLVGQVLQKGLRVVIASPDKDFKQLISEDVQIVVPVPHLNRWSFYTLKHYRAQYNCDPQSDLSLRCILGDEVDGVPGIQNVVPSFGRKTALKLLQKHGNLENLLAAAAVRTVGRDYIQNALTQYADYLRRNYEVLSLKSDVDVRIDDNWLSERHTGNDSMVGMVETTAVEALIGMAEVIFFVFEETDLRSPGR
nr:5'-3' exonuclease isoform X1 [Ipomoea batatas]